MLVLQELLSKYASIWGGTYRMPVAKTNDINAFFLIEMDRLQIIFCGRSRIRRSDKTWMDALQISLI